MQGEPQVLTTYCFSLACQKDPDPATCGFESYTSEQSSAPKRLPVDHLRSRSRRVRRRFLSQKDGSQQSRILILALIC